MAVKHIKIQNGSKVDIHDARIPSETGNSGNVLSLNSSLGMEWTPVVKQVRLNGALYSPTAGVVDLGDVSGGGGGASGTFSVVDDNNGNISLVFTADVMTLTDDNAGNVGLVFA